MVTAWESLTCHETTQRRLDAVATSTGSIPTEKVTA